MDCHYKEIVKSAEPAHNPNRIQNDTHELFSTNIGLLQAAIQLVYLSLTDDVNQYLSPDQGRF